MTLQSIRRTVETPIRTALLALTPPIKPLTENESYTENTALSEFALLSLSFGLMAEPSVGCSMDEFIRASLVITIYTQKSTGPGRAQHAAQAVMTAIAGLGRPTATPVVAGVKAWPLGMSGPTFTPMDGRPHLATRITAPLQAKVT